MERGGSTPGSRTALSDAGSGRLASLLTASVLLATLGFLAPMDIARHAFWAAALAVFLIAMAIYFVSKVREKRAKASLDAIKEFIANDAAPSLLSTQDGSIHSANSSAHAQFGGNLEGTVSGTLRTIFTNPGGIVFRLQTRADLNGSAREDLITRKGHMRLSVHKIGQEVYVWRLENIASSILHAEGPSLPMIIVGRAGALLYMNDAARTLAGGRVNSLQKLFSQPKLISGTVCDLNGPDGPVPVLISELEAGAGRRAIYLLPPGPEMAPEQSWSVFQDLPVPLLKVNAEGTVQAYNKMAAGLVGVALRDNAQLSDLMEGLGRSITDWLGENLIGRSQQPTEFLRLKRADKEVFVQVTLNRVTEGGKVQLIAVLNDATELKSLEAQFVQSQKMQAIGQLAGGVAHDFNNLLTAISGHCDLLLLRHDQGDPDFGDLVQINQNANRAAALVGQLLAFSRKQTLRPETLDMRDTLSDLTHLLNRLVGEKVTLTLSHDPVLKPIRADKRQLEQVLMNLVVNARDAMPKGGEIRIVTECTTLKEPLERDNVSVAVGDYITVQVMDEGTGIAPDKLQKVFEPFFTTKRTGEGTGLGLSTAYGIVKQTGGFIFVDSTLGSGTCFTLYFPVLEAVELARNSPRSIKTSMPVKHGDGVILLVEDEAPVRAFASRALRLRGYTVLEAESAEDALKTLEDETLNIDVFVTDVVMPGMDGPSWVREALKARPDVRVVFVSGYAEDSFGETQIKIPNSVFLPKPFSLTDLTETVHRQLH